jgi:hypothetical protein
MGSVHLASTVVTLLTVVAIYSNAFSIGYAIFSVVYEKINGARVAQRRAREQHRRVIQQHVRKLWRTAYGYAFTEVYLRDKRIRSMPVQVFLELARRDRAARMDQTLDRHLAPSLYPPTGASDHDQLSASQIGVELPRPLNVSSPRAASGLFSSQARNGIQTE